MTTVAQLIAHLQTLPQTAVVEVGRENTSGYSVSMDMCTLDTTSTKVFDFSTETTGIYAGRIVVELRSD